MRALTRAVKKPELEANHHCQAVLRLTMSAAIPPVPYKYPFTARTMTALLVIKWYSITVAVQSASRFISTSISVVMVQAQENCHFCAFYTYSIGYVRRHFRRKSDGRTTNNVFFSGYNEYDLIRKSPA
jgi:hypothetical protein